MEPQGIIQALGLWRRFGSMSGLIAKHYQMSVHQTGIGSGVGYKAVNQGITADLRPEASSPRAPSAPLLSWEVLELGRSQGRLLHSCKCHPGRPWHHPQTTDIVSGMESIEVALDGYDTDGFLWKTISRALVFR